jgi:ssDNA-specific exonuclease RecJ
MGLCYNTIKQHYNQIFANDIFEYAEKLSFLDKRASTAQFMFALLVFADLEFIQISSFTNPIITIANTQKRELTSSKFYNSFIKEG